MITAIRIAAGLLAVVFVHAADQVPADPEYRPIVWFTYGIATVLVVGAALFDLNADRLHRWARGAERRAARAETRAALAEADAAALRERWVNDHFAAVAQAVTTREPTR